MPTDSYGNNCGKPGTDTADLSKVLYPDLDSDIIAHAGLIATGQYLTFLTSVTRLCAHTCPAGVSLRGPPFPRLTPAVFSVGPPSSPTAIFCWLFNEEPHAGRGGAAWAVHGQQHAEHQELAAALRARRAAAAQQT